jgi:hypothetical protein
LSRRRHAGVIKEVHGLIPVENYTTPGIARASPPTAAE